jgi:DnaJ-class molecular chaperone
MLMMNMAQNWVANKKIKKATKLLIFITFFIGNLSYNSKTFMETRSPTLYDIFDISRTASFEEIKKAKDLYL